MNDPHPTSSPTQSISKFERAKIINYSLRPAKNIERKMMGEAFARLTSLCALSEYRYVGFGSEFFNDFSLYHQTLGIRQMVSIERDEKRMARCEFNRPYKCVEVLQGTASQVLPTLSWKRRSIVWLDYTEKLSESILEDVRFVVSQASSGSLLVWTVNSEPWAGEHDEDSGDAVKQSEWPKKRLQKLRNLVGAKRVRSELTGSELAQWGLAKVFHEILTDEIRSTLNDRNAAASEAAKLAFRQCFHFRYADGQRMLTVGGILLNPA
ncbi:MAG TPA: O-methyltransferase, partial [Candidatus Eremiobacteraceae bacterium]|nr:O-methyltransferase [Candidatus Eremiobacteraceae bacterium]